MPEHRQVIITGRPSRDIKARLRVNTYPDRGMIEIRDNAIHLGIERREAIALATALVEAVEILDGTARN